MRGGKGRTHKEEVGGGGEKLVWRHAESPPTRHRAGLGGHGVRGPWEATRRVGAEGFVLKQESAGRAGGLKNTCGQTDRQTVQSPIK